MKKILITDNSDLSFSIINESLKESGITTARAANVLETLRSIYREVPDCIIISDTLPVMNGRNTASLIKSRRGINKIPLILISAEPPSPEKIESADIVIARGENLSTDLKDAINSLSGYSIPHDIIDKDAASMNTGKLFSITIGHLEDKLMEMDIISRILDISAGCRLSLDETINRGLKLMSESFGAHCAVILLEQFNRPESYIRVEKDIYRSDVDEFMTVCLNDFYREFSGLNLEQLSEHLFNTENRRDFNRLRIDGRKISSYFFSPLKGAEGRTIGTIHLGNLANNYYTESMTRRITLAIKKFEQALENALNFSTERETRLKIHHVFSKFVPEEIITGLVTKGSDAELMVGEKRKIVVLFSDIRSFTTITETNHPEDVVKLLNEYFDTQVSIIKKYGGTIDKFIGDAIFAIFGAPISYEDNVQRAVNAAIGMIKSLSKVRTSHMNIPGGEIKIGIGLHEGDAIVGNIGSSTKFDYTAIGDTVNLAARLEGYTKYYNREILLSREVYEKLSGDLPVREVDYVRVKGKDIATSLFAVETDPLITEPEYMEEYRKAYRMYKLGNFTTALEFFSGMNLIVPHDPIVNILIDRCREFIDSPPGEWDGSLVLDFK